MLNLLQFSELGKSPEWRNWQTRWTQNPVVLSTVWVRPPPPGPLSFQPFLNTAISAFYNTFLAIQIGRALQRNEVEIVFLRPDWIRRRQWPIRATHCSR